MRREGLYFGPLIIAVLLDLLGQFVNLRRRRLLRHLGHLAK